MRIVIAPDGFKGSLGADRAAEAIARGWRAVRSEDELVLIPQADGGEGTLAAMQRARPDAVLREVDGVTGPDGRQRTGVWLDLGDGTAVVELAAVAGIELMGTLDPLGATSRGLGEVMAAALDAGAQRLVIGIGGSASTDAGRPVLDALAGRPVPLGGAVVLSDVRAPLLGPTGAAAVFGPQKGATPDIVLALEERLAQACAGSRVDPSTPGAGAAGGVGFALLEWGATILEGAQEIGRLSGLEAAAATADLVITGEGRFDEQSLVGKVVGAVIALGAPAVIIAGSITVPEPVPSFSLVDLAGSVEGAMSEPERWLEVAGAEVGRAVGSSM